MDSRDNQSGEGSCWRLKSVELFVASCLILSSIGCVYVCDIPGALQDVLMKTLHLSSSEFSLFYSLYSLPCIFVSAFGGVLIDSSIGLRNSMSIFLIVVVIGSVLFSVGGPINAFPVMIIGRFLLGCGIETVLGPGIMCYILIWFKKNHLNLVYSLTDNFCYIGTTLVYFISNRMYEAMTHYWTNIEALNIILVINSCVILVPILGFISIMLITKLENETNRSGEFKFTSFITFPPAYWTICFAYTAIANATFTFEMFSQVYFMNEFGMTANEASNPITVMNLVKIALAVPLSLLVDQYGRNLFFFILAVIVCLVSHSLLLFKVNPFFCMTMLGVSYSLTGSSIWPMIGYLLDESNYGTAFGILTSILNFTSFIYPMIAGKVIDDFGYTWLQMFYLIVLGMSFSSLLVIWTVGGRSRLVLNMSAQQRKLHEIKGMSQSTHQLSSSFTIHDNYQSIG